MGGRQRTFALAALGGLLVVAAVASQATAAARPAPGGRIVHLELAVPADRSGAVTSVRQAGQDSGVRLFWASPVHSPEGTRVVCVRGNSIRGRAITEQTISIGPRE
jgi:hypothetical protein